MFRSRPTSLIALAAALFAATATAQTPAPRLTDLSESGQAFSFAVDKGGARITVSPLSAASWDELEFEVGDAEVGYPLLFVVPGSAGHLLPATTTGGFRWRPAPVLSGGAPGALQFMVLPERPRFTVRLDRGAATTEAPYYQYSRFVNYIAQVAQEPRAQVSEIGVSLQGRPLYRIIIDEPSTAPKKTVLMTVRQHGNEHGPSYVLEGALDLLLGRNGLTPDPRLLDRVRWIIYPLVNPDGAVANQRGNLNGVDLNRNWARGGCDPGQQQETFLHQCDIETMHARYGISIGGDHHAWGSSNHGGFRYSQGQSVSFVTAPEYEEARKDTLVVARNDPTQFSWTENGGTAGMVRAELFLRYGFLLHTPEYNSSISSPAEFHLKGQQWVQAMYETLYAVDFTDAFGTPVREVWFPGRVWVQVDDLDENVSSTRRETVTVVVQDAATADEESLILTETEPGTGVFRSLAPLRIATGPAVRGNGVLESRPGSLLTARYTDDDYPRNSSSATRHVMRVDVQRDRDR